MSAIKVFEGARVPGKGGGQMPTPTFASRWVRELARRLDGVEDEDAAGVDGDVQAGTACVDGQPARRLQ